MMPVSSRRRMQISDSRRALILTIYEKIVVGVAVAAVSAVLLYVYNIYSKAFEAAQLNSRAYTSIAIKLKDVTIENSLKAAHEFRTAFSSEGNRFLPKGKGDSIFAFAGEIENVSFSLELKAPQTAAIAQQIAKDIKLAVVEFSVQLGERQIAEFDRKIAKSHDMFLAAYNSEVSLISLAEFQSFLGIYEKTIPNYLQPIPVLLACGIFVGFISVVLWFVLA